MIIPTQTPHIPSMECGSSRKWRALSSLFAVAATFVTISASAPDALAMPPWPGDAMQPGIAAGTCAAPASLLESDSFVLGMWDFRNPPAANYGPGGIASPLWLAPNFHHPDWSVKAIGNVYGIAIDSRGDTYVAAHGLYSKNWSISYHHRYGDLGGGANDLGAAGTIYKIDHVTGAPSVFATLPQQATNLGGGFISGPGIGNIAYDPDNNQFFATNLEDGKIYCIDSAGTITSSFDPLNADDGAAGMPSRRERCWGINVFGGQVFYAMWNSGTVTQPVQVRRIDIVAGGFIPATDIQILTVPGDPTYADSIPVADLTFSADGNTMVLGERTMLTDTSSYNHQSDVHIAEFSGGLWTITRTLKTGNNGASNGETYGGVAYGPEDGAEEALIWMSSADTATAAGPHGFQGTRPDDFPLAAVPNNATNSYRVPYDATATTSGPDVKGSGGDVEIMQGRPDEESCLTFRPGRIECPQEPGAAFEFPLSILNDSGQTAVFALLTPCLDDELPAGAETVQPAPGGVITLPSITPSGSSTSINISLPGFSGGETVCFRVTLLNETGGECCTEKLCVELPDCECSSLVDSKVECRILPDGTVKYLITLVVANNTHLAGTPHDFVYATFLPPAGIDPSLVSTDPSPITPGSTGTVTTCYFGDPGELCFNVGLHDAQLDECCSLQDVCITIPRCDDEPPVKPDDCRIDRSVFCDPETRTATINYAICNNSSAPRTYDWIATGIINPDCDAMFDVSDFSPATGTIGPIAPGDCVSTTITVDCRDIELRDCAAVRICARPRNVEITDEELRLLCCESIVTNCPIIIDVPSDEPVVPASPDEPVCIIVKNPTRETFTDLEVRIYSDDGALLFDREPGIRIDRSTPLFTRTIGSLEPDSEEKIIIYIDRFDPGDSNFIVEILPRARIRPKLSLYIPSRGGPIRSPEELPARFNRVLASGEDGGAVEIEVSTARNVRYQLQKSLTLGEEWEPATCTVGETPIAAGGTFMGTGDDIRCFIPCGDEQDAMFFRVVTEPPVK